MKDINLKMAEAGESSLFVTVDYQEQQKARKDRMLERAANARDNRERLYTRAKNRASVIPFGQPILPGHHSERRDRRYRGQIQNTFEKSFEEGKKADYYERKAENVGSGGIASNDPEAVKKLKAKLAGLEKSQETMKAVNKIIRSVRLSDDEKAARIMEKELLTQREAADILKPDFSGRIGFAAYSLQNNNAEINRLKKRISELDTLREMTPISHDCDDFSVCVEDGRIVVDFKHGKPSEEVRNLIKTHAFKWSRYSGCWVRKATMNALFSAENMLERLKSMDAIYS